MNKINFKSKIITLNCKFVYYKINLKIRNKK